MIKCVLSHIGRGPAVCFVLCLFALQLQAATYSVRRVPNVQLSDRMRYTSNPDGILSPEAVKRIDALCDSLRSEGLAQVVVVAVEDIEGDDVFDFAIELFRSWGVGRSDVDNGLGVLFVLDRREIRFVTGGGLEGVLTDAMCKRIQLGYMVPAFREGDYDGGLVAGMEAVAQLLRDSGLDFGEEEEDEESIVVMLAVILLVVVMFAVLIYVALRQQTLCPKCGKRTLKETETKTTKLYIEYIYVCSECGHRVVRRCRRSNKNSIGGGPFIGGMPGGGSLGGGSFGGGGGSFGGGSFGGGGAGTRW